MKWLIRILSKSNKNKRGFTLIELMVVVIVVGILAAAAIPIYRFAMSRAYSSEAKASIGSMISSMKIFYVENDYSYPDGVGESFSVFGDSDEGDQDADIMSILGVDTDTNTWWHCGWENDVAAPEVTCSFGTADDGTPTHGALPTWDKINISGGTGPFVWAVGDAEFYADATTKVPIYGIEVCYDLGEDVWYTGF